MAQRELQPRLVGGSGDPGALRAGVMAFSQADNFDHLGVTRLKIPDHIVDDMDVLGMPNKPGRALDEMGIGERRSCFPKFRDLTGATANSVLQNPSSFRGA